jgi:hypothetical protein
MGSRVQAPASEGVGYHFPERKSDCSGGRPSWFPFQIAVCDVDEEAPDPLPTERHRRIPDWPED